MPEDIFRTQLLILGLIDHILDLLKANDRKAARDDLLAAIQATCMSKLLENEEVAGDLRAVLGNLPAKADIGVALQNMEQVLRAQAPNIDILTVLRNASEATLQDFVAKVHRPDLSEIITGVLL